MSLPRRAGAPGLPAGGDPAHPRRRPLRSGTGAAGRARADRATPVHAALAVSLLVAVLTGACGGDQEASTARAGSSTAATTVTTADAPTRSTRSTGASRVTVDPCALVGADEAAGVLGPLADAPERQSRAGRPAGCAYAAVTGATLSLTVDAPAAFERAARLLDDTAVVRDDTILVDNDRLVAVWFRTPTAVIAVNGPPDSLAEVLGLAELAERNLTGEHTLR